MIAVILYCSYYNFQYKKEKYSIACNKLYGLIDTVHKHVRQYLLKYKLKIVK